MVRVHLFMALFIMIPCSTPSAGLAAAPGVHSRRNIMRIADLRIATRLYGGFATIVLLLGALVTVATLNVARLADANAINTHTYQVLAENSAILESLINMETGQRGYVITGAEASLEPYKAG